MLGRQTFARALAEAVLSYNHTESISIGLLGEWGTGKTSIINMTLEMIDEISNQKDKAQTNPTITKFYPWNYSDQNQLIVQFFNQISAVLSREDLGTKYKKIGSTIQTYSRFFIPLSYLPMVSPIGDAAKAFGCLGAAATKAGEGISQDLHSIRKDINGLLKDLDNKIIIVIDDIDRLNNTEIRQIFQLVKSVADFPNTIYLLSFDRNVVINALSEVQKGPGDKYLEKVVQVPFEIPQISKHEVEKLLFSQLDELIKDIPEERWDQIYWGNIYHSGLKYLFNNIRDVNRFMNSLNFGLSLVKDEVNPIDFIAITAVQVFIPELYKNIKDNKHLFVGTRIHHRDTEDKIKSDKVRIASFIKEVKQLPEDVLSEFLQYLFPRLEYVEHHNASLELWRKKGRLCSADIFETYFRLDISKDEMPLIEIKKVLSEGNDLVSFSTQLIKLVENKKIVRFLERMEDYTREDIPEEHILTIITALMDLGDLFPSEYGGFFHTDTPLRILRLFDQLSHRFQKHEKRFEIFKYAINKTENSLFTIVHEISVQCQQHGIYGLKDKEDDFEKQTVTKEQLEELVTLALNKIECWANNGKLAKHDKLLNILYAWLRWSDVKRVSSYVKSIIKSDHNLIELLVKFLISIKSHTTTDYIGSIKWKMNYKDLSTFLELNETEKRVRRIKSLPEFNELDDEKQRAINIFLDTLDGNR